MVTIEQKLFESGGKKSWVIEQDKVEHFAFGFVLSFMGILYLPLIILGYAFGYGKELYDQKYGTGWDIDDLVATTLGAGLALILVVVVR